MVQIQKGPNLSYDPKEVSKAGLAHFHATGYTTNMHTYFCWKSGDEGKIKEWTMNRREFTKMAEAMMKGEDTPNYFFIHPKTANVMGLKEGDMYAGGKVALTSEWRGEIGVV